jgi:phosphopantothenoylcysteine decarboxylase/phosphopantothenate--cysteine ligase
MSSKNVLFFLTGSIACAKTCTVISRLAQAGVTVQTAVTPAALHFVGKATLEGLSGRRVYDDMWAEGAALDHIEFARATDLVLVCPATANSLNRLAAGIADDLLGTLFLAWELDKKPWLVVPAMNHRMWLHPATQAGVAKLRGWGVRFLEPAEGMHACGEGGPGRLPEPEAIAAEVLKALG